MTLYNLKSEDGQWRITKFDNGLNVESSYLTSETECECPAGSRPVCRHRTMLPRMLNVGAEDSGMFYDFDADQFLEPLSDAEDTQSVIVSPSYQYDEYECPGHVASSDNAKICALCGTHVDSLRPDDEVEARSALSTSSPTEPILSGLQEEQILMGFHQPKLVEAMRQSNEILDDVVKAAPHPSIGAIKRRI